jgi:UDP-N-acetylglucosamine 4,6-dehydratase
MNTLNESISDLINNNNILITGGTGSFGHKLVEVILKEYQPKRLIILSRDEYKQYLMQQRFAPTKYKCLRYFIGDIRDLSRLEFAFKDVDIIFHAAALKQVPTLEYNPMEAIKTNINGSENIIKASIKCNVKRVIALSTDKSVNPVNLYGATKMCSERLFVAANNFSGSNGTIFSVIRYGNVLGSRGSVLPLLLKQKSSGTLTITDPKMTRFTLTLKDSTYFVLNCLSYMIGGEIFIPRIPSYSIIQLANLIDSTCNKKIIGIRPGEKINECLIGFGESYLTLDCKDFFVITPFIEMSNKNYLKIYQRFNPIKLKPNTEYNSGNNTIIKDEELLNLINEYRNNHN